LNILWCVVWAVSSERQRRWRNFSSLHIFCLCDMNAFGMIFQPQSQIYCRPSIKSGLSCWTGASTMMSAHATLEHTHLVHLFIIWLGIDFFGQTVSFPFLVFLKSMFRFSFLFDSVVPNCFGAGCPQAIRKPRTRKPWCSQL
jgi:hypothetical protein